MRIIGVLFLAILWALAINGQPSCVLQGDVLNRISNESCLSNAWLKLKKIENNNSGTFSILHIGDSHIQADFQTHVTRLKLQEKFGNAGRGIVFPYPLAKTSKPRDLIWHSSRGPWQREKLVNHKKRLSIGLSGYTLVTYYSKQVNFKLNDPSVNDNSFSKITLFTGSKANVSMTSGTYSKLRVSQTIKKNRFQAITFKTSVPTSELHLSLKPSNAFFFYGLNLETEKKGVIYHALGVNSSSFKDYVYSGTLWLEQSALLNPNIVVISLGTNDAQDYNMTKEVFQKQVTDLILSVRKYIPNAAIVLTTPPASYFRKLNPNPMLPMINEVIREVSIKYNCAYWDLFEIMGGADSIKEWVEKEWARPDYVHLSIQGYEWIGTKFYEAILKSYESATGN